MDASAQEPLRMKIVVIGSHSVGKTSIINAYISAATDTPTTPTIQLAFSKKETVIGERVLDLQICDTAGQEQFQSVSPIFYREAHGALVVYDVTSPQSFQRIRYWLDELNATMPDSFIVCVVGNKIDRAGERVVAREDGVQFASENGALYQETSAVTGRGIDAAFGKICEKFLELERGKEAMLIPAPPVGSDRLARREDGGCDC
jgi:small GTP-binding protein